MDKNPLKIQSLLNPSVAPDSKATPPVTRTNASPSRDMSPVSTPTISTISPSPSAPSFINSSYFTNPDPFQQSHNSTPVRATKTNMAASNQTTFNNGGNNRQFRPCEPNALAAGLSPAEKSKIRYELKTRYQILPGSGNADDLIGSESFLIPYRSNKNNFNSVTGKYSFEAWLYTFKINGETWLVMWDKDDGFTKIGDFFKARGFPKTTANQAIQANPGLSDISFNILGGKTHGKAAAQGYWMPHNCARALAANFCYNIRYALVPVFGPSFVRACLAPNHANYGTYKIDPAIINADRATYGLAAVPGTTASASVQIGQLSPRSRADGTSTAPFKGALPGSRVGKKRKASGPYVTDILSPYAMGTYLDAAGYPRVQKKKHDSRGRLVDSHVDHGYGIKPAAEVAEAAAVLAALSQGN